MSAPPPTSAHYIQGGENWGSWDKIKVPWSKLKTNWKSLSYVQVVLFQNHRFLRQVAQNMKQDFIRFYMLSPCQTHVGNTKLILVWSSSPRRGRSFSFSLPTGHNKRSGHKKLSRNSLHMGLQAILNINSNFNTNLTVQAVCISENFTKDMNLH